MYLYIYIYTWKKTNVPKHQAVDELQRPGAVAQNVSPQRLKKPLELHQGPSNFPSRACVTA